MVVMTAAVLAAGVRAIAVRVIMMVAADVGIVAEIAAEQSIDCRVRLAAYAAVELDARLGKRSLCAAADASANQGIHAALH